MSDKIFDIAFSSGGAEYRGWVNPSDKTGPDGNPTSYHVVLNGASFGYLAFNDCKWTINEERPQALTEAAGLAIQKHYEL